VLRKSVTHRKRQSTGTLHCIASTAMLALRLTKLTRSVAPPVSPIAPPASAHLHRILTPLGWEEKDP
jgi:hypothetical protein